MNLEKLHEEVCEAMGKSCMLNLALGDLLEEIKKAEAEIAPELDEKKEVPEEVPSANEEPSEDETDKAVKELMKAMFGDKVHVIKTKVNFKDPDEKPEEPEEHEEEDCCDDECGCCEDCCVDSWLEDSPRVLGSSDGFAECVCFFEDEEHDVQLIPCKLKNCKFYSLYTGERISFEDVLRWRYIDDEIAEMF